MIAFGSQRAGGADLATHLSNAEDNEYVEVADLRGSIASDLHGAFAEWEAQAHAMTKAKKYLYSLSVNPDPAQGPLTRDQYMDYIARAEERLGLAGQPRAIVFHIKESREGNLREHCHVVWSRTDVQDLKAVHIAYDRSKLMMVAREFAHDHGLSLPEGYQTGRAKADQLSLYDKAQMDQTGLSKEERMEVITDLWRRSDNAKAFVGALEDHGYILANGRRPYVLVDIYGHMNALPRMIDDKTVRAKDVAAFLAKDFPSDALPSVEDAKELAARHLQERKSLKQTEQQAEEIAFLKNSQDNRRAVLELEFKKEKAQAEKERAEMQVRHETEKTEKRRAQEQENFEIQFRRAQNAPIGLARFLAKVSGFSFVQSQLHKLEDQQRRTRHKEELRECLARLDAEWRKQQYAHQLQMIELERKRTAQTQTFQRETRSLTLKHQRANELVWRQGCDHMPALGLTLGPPGRKAAPHKAKNRYILTTAKEMNIKARPRAEDEPVNLREDFSFAAKPQSRGRSGSSKKPDTEIDHRTDRDGGKKR